MSYARYYLTFYSKLLAQEPAFIQGTPLVFTAGKQWTEMTIRGVSVDSRRAAVPASLLATQVKMKQGGGELLWVADHIYECVFSDFPIGDSFLHYLRPACQLGIYGHDLLCYPSHQDLAKFGGGEDPPPPPPPQDAPNAPFDPTNVFSLV